MPGGGRPWQYENYIVAGDAYRKISKLQRRDDIDAVVIVGGERGGERIARMERTIARRLLGGMVAIVVHEFNNTPLPEVRRAAHASRLSGHMILYLTFYGGQATDFCHNAVARTSFPTLTTSRSNYY